MYDELIKNLRICSRCDFGQNCNECTQERTDKFCCDELLHQAADAIEELQGELQALKDDTDMAIVEDGKTTRLCFVKKWIPVTERLPEDRQRVLAITLYKTRPRSSHYRLVYFSNNLESVDNFDFEGESRCGFYYYDSEYGFCEVDDVTHWMPLPHPPESEGE